MRCAKRSSSTGSPYARHGQCLALAIASVLAVAPTADAQVLIDTTPTWDGSYTMGSLCWIGAFGQTFTIAEPTTVDSFSFFMKTTPPMSGGHCDYDPAYCEPWAPSTTASTRSA